jgi:hypothetical protein
MIELCGIKMYSPKELKEMTGLGKNKIYELLNDGSIEHVNWNGKIMITDRQIMEGVERKTVRRPSSRLYSKV